MENLLESSLCISLWVNHSLPILPPVHCRLFLSGAVCLLDFIVFLEIVDTMELHKFPQSLKMQPSPEIDFRKLKPSLWNNPLKLFPFIWSSLKNSGRAGIIRFSSFFYHEMEETLKHFLNFFQIWNRLKDLEMRSLCVNQPKDTSLDWVEGHSLSSLL